MGTPLNSVIMSVASAPGTGTITLGSALSGFQSFAAGGAVNGGLYTYRVDDGGNFAIEQGAYGSSGSTLTRGLIFSSTGAALNLSSAALVTCIASAADLAATPPVRQTVQSGPASSGLPSFLPSTASGLAITTQNISAATPLVVTAAQSLWQTAAPNINLTLTTNLTWSLAPNITNYLFVNTLTGATSVSGTAPVYQAGGTPSTANGTFTFDTAAMVGYFGNGSTAAPTPLVCVGQATTSSSAVTSAVAYAYNGVFESAWTATLPVAASTTAVNHNLGCQPGRKILVAECTATDAGYAVGDQIDTTSGLASQTGQPAQIPPSMGSTPTTLTLLTSVAAAWVAISRTDYSTATLTRANWRYRFRVARNWGNAI